MDRRVIVFEEIRQSHAWWVRWYCWRGLDVYYLRVSSGVAQKAWFRRLVDGKKVYRFSFARPLYYGWNPAPDRAYAIVESLYAQIFAQRSPMVEMERLYNSADVHLAFKKVLNEELVDPFYCDLLRERLGETFRRQSMVTIIPSEPGAAFRYDQWRAEMERLQAAVSVPIRLIFPLWLRLAGRLQNLKARARTLGIYLYVGFVLLMAAMASRKGAIPARSLRYAIAIYSPIREFANAIRGVGFLLDGNHIRKDNTVFVPLAPLTNANRAHLHRNGLQLAELPAAADWATVGLYLTQLPWVVSALLFQPEWVSRTYAGMLRAYGLWKGFTDRYPVSHFITYCDFGFRHIGRNILFRQAGVSTWFYVDTVNGPDNLPKPEDGVPYRQAIYGFLMYDHFVSWCERHARWNRMLHQKIGAYHDVGCLWSEHIRLIKEGRIPSFFPERLAKAGYQSHMKVVSAFDSWFYNAERLTSSDLIAFIEGLERILNDFDDIFLVIKEKKERWFFQEPFFPEAESRVIYEAYEALAKRPRCFTPGSETNPSEIVAVSDLVIVYPFTSVGIEALGARCRAIFYDPLDKMKRTSYDNISGLVSHGYDELLSSIRHLLYEVSKEEYEMFLDAKVKGEAESYLDGRALTRFRQLLTR